MVRNSRGRSPQSLDEHVVDPRPLPSMLMAMALALSTSVNASAVNWLPWSVLKISGRPKRVSALSRASTQKSLMSVLLVRQAMTLRL